MIPVAFPIFTNNRKQSPHCRRQTNRFALALFALTALVGLAIKYLP